jgi:hypothetical protein
MGVLYNDKCRGLPYERVIPYFDSCKKVLPIFSLHDAAKHLCQKPLN